MIGKDPVPRGEGTIDRRSANGLRPRRFGAMAVTAVLGVVAAYLVIHFIAGIIGTVIDVAIVAGILYVVARVLTRKHRSD